MTNKRQLFDFEAERPPVLTEGMLREELGRRELNRHMLVLALAAVFVELCLILSAMLLWETQPLLSAVCLGYVMCSACVGVVLSVVCTVKRREILWQQ